jgi:hypothetical protein
MNPVVTRSRRTSTYTAGMSLVVRALLVWLLALAIPVQGAVAAAMRCCGPEHHHQGQRVNAGDGHAHDHAMVTGHDHGAPAAAVDTDSAAADTDPNSDAHAATLKAGKCSACSSCCTAAGLPSRQAVLGSVPFGEVLVASVGTPLLEFLTSGPERPPRPFPV